MHSTHTTRTLQSLSLPLGVPLHLLLRPLRGDHLHYAFSVYVKGKLLKQFYDRPTDQWIYEGRHLRQACLVHVVHVLVHV